jgi:hypothetical protein
MKGMAMIHRPASHWRRCSLAGFAIFTAFASGACAGPGTDKAPIQPGADAPKLSVESDQVPSAVTQVGYHSENVYDLAKIADWPRARASTDSLRSALELLSVADRNTDVIRSLRDTVAAVADSLDRAITSGDKVSAMRSANRLTQLGAIMAAPYGPGIPSDVTLLDFYGRELELWAAVPTQSAEARLRETASAIGTSWDAIRQQVIAKGGSSEAAGFDSLVTQVMTARTRADYARLATPLLDQVDFLERVFTR